MNTPLSFSSEIQPKIFLLSAARAGAARMASWTSAKIAESSAKIADKPRKQS